MSRTRAPLLLCGDSMEELESIPSNFIDAVVTDPPYGLSFMGRAWDYQVPGKAVWQEVLRVMKPGAHLLAFFGSRTYHRGVVEIEDAGFEIRDCVMWVYGSGFPKGQDIGKAIDKAARGVPHGGVDTSSPNHGKYKPGSSGAGPGSFMREMGIKVKVELGPEAIQWNGWNTALKPAHEPIVLARKPLEGTVAGNVLRHGVGGLNIDGCRIEGEPWKAHSATGLGSVKFFTEGHTPIIEKNPHDGGRWPANLIHDGSPENLSLLGDAQRYFYCSKASKADRGEGNPHPTVKPQALMRYLCRLITPPNGLILDPFMGSGSTGVAAIHEGFRFAGIDLDPDYVALSRKRIHQAIEEATNTQPNKLKENPNVNDR